MARLAFQPRLRGNFTQQRHSQGRAVHAMAEVVLTVQNDALKNKCSHQCRGVDLCDMPQRVGRKKQPRACETEQGWFNGAGHGPNWGSHALDVQG
eukprot:7352692-Pyramimonas_sp.AAC.1